MSQDTLPAARAARSQVVVLQGDPGGHRTRDLRIKSPLLCQLSYRVERQSSHQHSSQHASGWGTDLWDGLRDAAQHATPVLQHTQHTGAGQCVSPSFGTQPHG